MNNNTENIIEHVKKVLVNFLSQSDTEEFIKSIRVHANSFSELSEKISDLDKEQVDINFTEGISERVIVDKIIIFGFIVRSCSVYDKNRKSILCIRNFN